MRVTISGIGLVTPLGVSGAENAERSLRGESAAGSLDLDGRCCPVGRAPEFDLESSLRFPKNVKFMNRPVRLALRAALDAVGQAGVRLADCDRERLAIYTGSGQTGLEYDEFDRALELAWEGGREPDYKYVGGRPSRLIDPYFSLRSLSNAGLSLLSTELGAQGPSANFVQGDTASMLALQSACCELIEGRCDLAVAGGYDCLLPKSLLLAYGGAGLLSGADPGRAGRPFDRDRDGLVPSEGSAMFVLERSGSAGGLGEILGFGLASETDPVGRPVESASVIGRAIRQAAASAGEPALDFAVARGIGTGEDDLHEMEALHAVLGQRVPITALKGQTGYLGAATAAVELAIGLLCARRGFIPPIAHLETPDPACALDVVFPKLRPLAGPRATGLYLSFTWGGQAAAIIARSAGD